MADREDRKRVFNPRNLRCHGGVGLLGREALPGASGLGRIAFVTWPVYRRLLHPLESHRSIAALIMTTLLIILLVVPVLWLLVRGRRVSDSFRETF
jgi:hypothetical protein